MTKMIYRGIGYIPEENRRAAYPEAIGTSRPMTYRGVNHVHRGGVSEPHFGLPVQLRYRGVSHQGATGNYLRIAVSTAAELSPTETTADALAA
ncbi:DUF4278 domain-containing protein [Pseudoruegeria sp. HB172150]|uniref:DUF4278 domain-containing protein n=1 Tax=Pseudoruegeria sp. HB172150 TaxID=2721164 RepID=UPI0015566D6A|nr:DUF4278 domain-containing protein [Pseudoruegeria sp. HB172150]